MYVIFQKIKEFINYNDKIYTVERRLSEPPLYEPFIIRTIISVSERSVIRK